MRAMAVLRMKDDVETQKIEDAKEKQHADSP
jgi:hypothetical protein